MPLLLRPSLSPLLAPKPEVASPYQATKIWNLLSEKLYTYELETYSRISIYVIKFKITLFLYLDIYF